MRRLVLVNDLYAKLTERLALKLLAGESGLERVLIDPDVPSPYQLVAGPLNTIHPPSIQLIGPIEHRYLSQLPPDALQQTLAHVFAAKPCALILTRDVPSEVWLVAWCTQHGVALFSSDRHDNVVLDNLQYYAAKFAAQRLSLHGVFLEVLGLGILITGHSAVGKSELALELVSRGQTLIADDAPLFTKIAPDIVSGSCPPLLANMLEVRGLGILDIRAMFGDSAIKREKHLHLIIHLKRMEHAEIAVMDRLQEYNQFQDVLGVDIPVITIPVASGRNLATLVETAVRNYKLRRKGYDAQQIFINRQSQAMGLDPEDKEA